MVRKFGSLLWSRWSWSNLTGLVVLAQHVGRSVLPSGMNGPTKWSRNSNLHPRKGGHQRTADGRLFHTRKFPMIDPYDRNAVILLLRQAAAHVANGITNNQIHTELWKLSDHLEQED